MPSLKEILDAISKAFGVGENITDPKQYDIKEFKRLKYQVEAAQDYIFVDERSGQYEKSNEEEIRKLKLHFRKRVFDSA